MESLAYGRSEHSVTGGIQAHVQCPPFGDYMVERSITLDRLWSAIHPRNPVIYLTSHSSIDLIYLGSCFLFVWGLILFRFRRYAETSEFSFHSRNGTQSSQHRNYDEWKVSRDHDTFEAKVAGSH